MIGRLFLLKHFEIINNTLLFIHIQVFSEEFYYERYIFFIPRSFFCKTLHREGYLPAQYHQPSL